MVFPPGQGKSGDYLMALWRHYLQEYAEREGSVESQVLVAANHSAEIFGFFSLSLDRDGRYRSIIDQRITYFTEGLRRAASFEDRLVNATFALYNHMNTLSQQFTQGNAESQELIRQVGEQVSLRAQSGGPIGQSAAAIRASFPLLGLMTLVLDRGQLMTSGIRHVEQRFVAGEEHATSEWQYLLNSLYRLVEMLQIFVTLSDQELRDQVQQIASRFQEEDQILDLMSKLRNGFCRLFELVHLVATHLDAILS